VKELQNLPTLYCRATFIREKRTNSYRFCTPFPIQLLFFVFSFPYTLELYLFFFVPSTHRTTSCNNASSPGRGPHTLVPLFSLTSTNDGHKLYLLLFFVCGSINCFSLFNFDALHAHTLSLSYFFFCFPFSYWLDLCFGIF
jgi:hypothetical protein